MNTLTVVGNVATDPDLRFTPSGSAVANFSIAQTPRKFNQETRKWEDAGEPNFFRSNVWNQQAENVANSLTKGVRVIAIGKLRTEKYERNGETVTSTNNLDIEHIGPSLAFATVKVERNQGGGGGEGGGNGGYQRSNNNSSPRPSYEKPASASHDSEPPF